jgi:hypothetical protein
MRSKGSLPQASTRSPGGVKFPNRLARLESLSAYRQATQALAVMPLTQSVSGSLPDLVLV